MATCRDVIKRALRMLGVLARGDEPASDEATDALEALKGLYLTPGLLGRLTPVVITADYTAGENERIFNADGAVTVTLPTTITDADSSEARTPKNRALVVVTGTNPGSFVYDAELGSWVQIDALTLASTAPFSTDLTEPLSARLAVSLSSDYGLTPPPAVAALSGAFTAAVALASGEARDEPAFY
jgi:hypothetical protein